MHHEHDRPKFSLVRSELAPYRLSGIGHALPSAVAHFALADHDPWA